MGTALSKITITPVILCGGAGSRLWPMSRNEKPKQFHKLFNEQSLLVNTMNRLPEGNHDGITIQAPIILGSAKLRGAFERDLKGSNAAPSKIFLEPSIRDTAAAIAAVTAAQSIEDDNSFLLVLPSDARIDDHVAFQNTVAKAARVAAATDAIMTIGIQPTRPETQYGYIEKGAPLGAGYSVKHFREKPCVETAQEYLDSGNFVWNAGMFLYRAGRMADAYKQLQPEIWKQSAAAVSRGQSDGVFTYLDKDAFDAAPKLSIDYAIMEKADNIGVVPAQFDWDDLGSWQQLYEGADKDAQGNATTGDVILVQANNNFVRSENVLVAAAGVENLSIIAEDNKVLVVPTNKAHLVKDVTTLFKEGFANQSALTNTSIKHWLFEKALPLWASNGMDFENGGAHEALAFDGSVAPHPKKRLRVTARQIYVYSHAHMMGWQGDADKILRHCFDTLVNTGWHEDGGFIHLYNPDGTVQNSTRDTYDQCFVSLAMAWLWRAKKWPEALSWGKQTLSFMDTHLADNIHGGYFENSEKSSPRRANPHMHFLEAMLAWYEATGDIDYLNRAEKFIDLFQQHFYDAATGSITERFNDDWSAITDPKADHDIEPGHHYEWAWLLMRYNALRPTDGLAARARTLFATANAFGHHEKTGAAADTMASDGSSISSRARCWPQTEALKAAIILEKSGMAAASKLRADMLQLLFDRYIDGPIEGGWYDAIDTDGQVNAPDMPSSTFYHIFCALAEHLESE